MTLHWWMHWFWITVVTPVILSLLLVLPPSLAAPQLYPSSPFYEDTSALPADFVSTSIPERPKFHSDSSLYVALFHGGASPPTFVEDDIDGTSSGVFPLNEPTDSHQLPASELTFASPEPSHRRLDDSFPFHVIPTDIQQSSDFISSPQPSHHIIDDTPAEPSSDSDDKQLMFARDIALSGKAVEREFVPSTPIPQDSELNHHTLDDTPIELTSDSDDGETKMFARDIALANRGSKAIGREYVPSTPIPQEVSNHNPFLGSSEIVSETQTLPPDHNNRDNEEDPTQEKQNSVNKSESEQEVISSTASPKQETADASSEEHFEANTNSPPIPSLAPPDWIPSFSGEEESAEEAEAEDNVRPNASLAEEESPVDADGSDSEAVTKGRMTAEQGLDAPSIIGIVLGLVCLVSLVGGAVGFVLYRRRFLNKPQTLNDKCSNADSSGYIDDTLRVSAVCMNSAGGSVGYAVRGSRRGARPKSTDTLALPNKDNSEEMYSLDNDSFLNSLEAMTIQNYWTDSVKHTKL